MIELIRQVYSDEDPMFYLSAVKRLPTERNGSRITWKSIHNLKFNVKRRNITKWTALGVLLKSNNFIETDARQDVIRKFL